MIKHFGNHFGYHFDDQYIDVLLFYLQIYLEFFFSIMIVTFCYLLLISYCFHSHHSFQLKRKNVFRHFLEKVIFNEYSEIVFII